MKNAVIRLIRFYQRHISVHLPASCRFYPTCSAYAVTAIEYYGVFKGGLLAAWRLLRCNPLSRGGYDPVPVPKRFRERDASSAGGEDRRE